MLHLSLMLFMDVTKFCHFPLASTKMYNLWSWVLWYHAGQIDWWVISDYDSNIPNSNSLWPGWVWVHCCWKQKQGKELKEPFKDWRCKDFINRVKQKTTCCVLKVNFSHDSFNVKIYFHINLKLINVKSPES